uniref:Regulator of G protein signaling 12b n=1 Tax=Oncorhynchus tshawytscha TaxID=74940 RepID=A0AAZ3QER9_ONCTS
MFRQTDTSSKRRHGGHGGLTALPSPPHPHQSGRIRGVEVARGRAGYGFTLSGQGPCVLNCILKGSPADYVGLRSGDHILSVNDINVSKASHEDVVKLIGRCTGVLLLVVAEGGNNKNPKLDSKTLGINRAERVVAEMQSGGIFNMIFDNSSHSSSSSEKGRSHSNPNLLSEEEMDRVLMADDAVFLDGFHLQEDFSLEPSEGILNVGMMVGYLGSIELASTGASLESDSLQAIRGSMRRLRAEQKIHSLVLMKVMHDCVRLCSDRRQVLATYPAEKLAFSACCPDDRRFFGLVTMQATQDYDGHYGNGNREEEGGLRTSCHVFIVDPELCHHQVHVGVARRFGFECTPDPDTGGCLEFPPTSQPLLQFVSVLYRDMGESIEGVRARAFVDPDNDPHSNSDSGIGNFLPDEKSNRVLLVDLGGHNHNPGPRHWDSPPPPSAPGWNQVPPGVVPGPPLSPPPPPHLNNSYPPPLPPAIPPRGAHSSQPSLHHYPPGKRGGSGGGAEQSLAPPQHHQSQRWLPVHVLRDWRQPGLCSDQESYAESTDGWSSTNCSTLPPPMNKIPADRYRAPLPAGDLPLPPQPPGLATQKDEWAKKLFGPAAGEKGLREPKQNGKRRGNGKDREKKVRIQYVMKSYSMSWW